MVDEPGSLVLHYLQRMDEKLDRLVEDAGDLKHRVTSLEERMGRMQAELASVHGDFAGLQARMDVIDQRVARIEKRLELVTA